jgi:molybdopterin molybdotransferase
MLQVAEAKERLLSKLVSVKKEKISIDEAFGRVLGESIIADVNFPLFSNSSMDGYAVYSDDLASASFANPVIIPVVSDIPAGKVEDQVLQPGQAMRIMTGAPIPDGADAVVPVEDTNTYHEQTEKHLPDRIKIFRPIKPGNNIRPIGEDFKNGDNILSNGHRLRAQDLGILTLLGKNELSVYKKPLIGLISTGDELLQPHEELTPGKIRETNSPTISSLIWDCGAQVKFTGIVKDNMRDIQNALDSLVREKPDMIISTAGVSVGVYDYVKKVIEEQGSLDFWRVKMRPGKPLAFGSYRKIPFVGLPGNPVSSFIGFEVFLRPALNFIGGEVDWRRLTTQATLLEDVQSDGRESYLRVFFEDYEGGLGARINTHQGSGNLFSLVTADGLIIVPIGEKTLPKGTLVEAWPWN